MSSLWVVNASPVITLAKIGQLRLLNELAETLLLPDAVVAEILAGQPGDAARVTIAAGWATRSTPVHVPHSLLEWGLGSGETAVLALALERVPATAILDDAGARTAARSLGIPLIGTVGVIMRAKLRGLIPSAAKLVGELQTAGLYLDERIVRTALDQIGEKWLPS